MNNVKTGDLARVVASKFYKQICPETIGRIYRITDPVEISGVLHWDTDPPHFLDGYRLPMAFADETLRRINGDQPGNEHWVTESRNKLKGKTEITERRELAT